MSLRRFSPGLYGLVALMLLVAAPAPASADWWPPSKWFSEDPKAEAVEGVCALAAAALEPLQEDRYEEFVANHFAPHPGFTSGQLESVSPQTVQAIFQQRESLKADLRGVSPKTIVMSSDLATATIVSVEENRYLNFVKHEGKWCISNRRQNLQLEAPATAPAPAATPAPAPAEQATKGDDNAKPVEPKIAASSGTVFKTAANTRVK